MRSSLSLGARSTRCRCLHDPGHLRWGPHFPVPRGRALVLSPEVGPSIIKSRGRALVLSPEERSSLNNHHQAKKKKKTITRPAWAFKQATLCHHALMMAFCHDTRSCFTLFHYTVIRRLATFGSLAPLAVSLVGYRHG